jgi:hypothetical protein
VTQAAGVERETAPQFCPWCGSPSPYKPEAHTPLWQRLAEESHQDAPQPVKEALHTEAFVTECPGCRRISHVIGHRVTPRTGET